MDSTSIADNSASEGLQNVSTAVSLNPATSGLQATEILSQPTQQEGKGDDEHTSECAELDVATDSPDAAGSSARGGTKVKEHALPNDIKDDVGIATDDLVGQKLDQLRYPQGWAEPSLIGKYRKNGFKYARVASIYVEGLESRVGVLEQELLELQYKIGSKDRPDEERQVFRITLFLVKCHICF